MSGVGDDPVVRLRELIEKRWLPNFIAGHSGTLMDAYAEVPKRGAPLLREEAAGFLRGIDSGVIEMVRDQEGRETGLCRFPGYRSYYCYEVIGRPTNSLPDVQLYREWLTHAAVATSLHLDYGYPKHSLSLDEDSFDIVVHGRHNEAFVAVEVKKSKRELDTMVDRLLELSRKKFDPTCGEKLSNADKKYRGLLALRPPIFFAVCPQSKVTFDVTYSHDPAGALLLERGGIPRYAEGP